MAESSLELVIEGKRKELLAPRRHQGDDVLTRYVLSIVLRMHALLLERHSVEIDEEFFAGRIKGLLKQGGDFTFCTGPACDCVRQFFE